MHEKIINFKHVIAQKEEIEREYQKQKEDLIDEILKVNDINNNESFNYTMVNGLGSYNLKNVYVDSTADRIIYVNSQTLCLEVISNDLRISMVAHFERNLIINGIELIKE